MHLQVGISVYQLAKMKILQFYYDCLDKFVSREGFQLIQMDTDSLYMAITGLKFDYIIKPEMEKQFELERNQWFPSTNDEMVEVESIGKKYKVSKKQFDKRTPGLFKLEWDGHAMIALPSKMYYCLSSGKSKNKASMKGIQAMKNKHLKPLRALKQVLVKGKSN